MKLTERHFRAIDLMIDGRSYVRIAADIGVGETTVRSWTRDADFQAAREERVAEIRAAVLDTTSAARGAALSFLVEALQNDGIPYLDRLKIAEATLDRTGDDPNDGGGADATLAKVLAKLGAG